MPGNPASFQDICHWTGQKAHGSIQNGSDLSITIKEGKMATPTQPLREEHAELLPHIELLRSVADSVGEMPLETLQHDVDRVHNLLVHSLIPHARAEDEALYPVIGKLLGSTESTATMSRDHLEIVRLTHELLAVRQQIAGVTINDAQTKALRRILYGLYTLVKVHFAKEEDIYLPLLDKRLTPEEAHSIFQAMGEVAREAGVT
jgi:hemerythrin-like domain-containing protein